MPLLLLALLTLVGCTDRSPASLGPAAAIRAAALPGTPVEGQVLIADQFNNRVIEVNQAGDIIWHFGLGPQDVSAASIIGTNDAERVGDLTLMAGTAAPTAATTTACCSSTLAARSCGNTAASA
jgi:hypothetical protein